MLYMTRMKTTRVFRLETFSRLVLRYSLECHQVWNSSSVVQRRHENGRDNDDDDESEDDDSEDDDDSEPEPEPEPEPVKKRKGRKGNSSK